MEELWKSTSFTDAYDVSNKGGIRNATSGFVRKLQVKEGKHYASLVAHGKDIKCNIAREVLTTFVRMPEKGENAHHQNGRWTDNRVENLEWKMGATYKQKTTPVFVTKESTGETIRFDSPKEAAAYIGKSRTAIFHNFGKEFVNGFKVGRVVPGVTNDYELDGPGEDVAKKEIKFGDKVIKVSADGWLKPCDGQWRKVTTERGGYLRTSFQFDRDGNTKRNRAGEVLSQFFELHRLVCEAFHGPPPGKVDAHHKDNNKLNNHPDNLEWASRSYNMLESYATGTNVSANENVTYKYHIGGEFTGDSYRSASEAARSEHGDVSGVTMCCNGTRLSHKNFEWSHMAPEEYDIQRGVMQASAKEFNKEVVRKRREKKGPRKSNGKPLYAYDAVTLELKGEYPSGKAAAEDTRCNTANISNCVKKRLKQTGGYIFTRSDEETFRAEHEEK